MAKVTMVTMFFIALVTLAVMPWVQGHVKWAKTLKSENNKKVTHLQFYFHDTVSGKTPSAVRIAQAPTTATSPTFFGALFMADNPLTVGPEPTSKLVGRAQGMYGSAGQTEVGIIMNMDYGFTDGIYNGSSISIVGRNRIAKPGFREMPVVGGTGVFRLARGYAMARTHSINITSGDAIVGYNVTIFHSIITSERMRVNTFSIVNVV